MDFTIGSGRFRSRSEEPSSEFQAEVAARAAARQARMLSIVTGGPPVAGASTDSTTRRRQLGESVTLSRRGTSALNAYFLLTDEPDPEINLGDLEGSDISGAVLEALGRDPEADGPTTPTTEDEFERTRGRRRRFTIDLDEAPEPSIEKVMEAPVVPEDQTVPVVEISPEVLALTEPPARIDTVVRRPTLGLVGYEDRFCTLEIFGKDANGDGDYVPMYNTSYSAPRHPINSNFLINRISHGTQEAVQIVRTFGDYYLSDVGENPTTVEVEGVLFESKNFPWLSEWRELR